MLGEYGSADKNRKNEIKEARKSMTLDLKGSTETPPDERLSLFEAIPAESFRRSVSVNDMVGLAQINSSEPPRLAWPGCAYFYSGGYGTLAQSKSSHQLTLLHNLPCPCPSSDLDMELREGLCYEVENECPPLSVIDGLGAGGYATVVIVNHNVGSGASTRSFAMKVVAKSKLRSMKDKERIRLELLCMTQIEPSPFVLRCYMAFESVTNVFFVTDLLNGGDLFFHLVHRIHQTGSGFNENESRILLSEIVVGIKHLHRHGFTHGDIKVENVLLDLNGHVTLIDLGLASRLDEGLSKGPTSLLGASAAHESGSLIYMSPEILNQGTSGRHSDWWALGILAHELLTGRTPWSSLTDKDTICCEINTLEIPAPVPLLSENAWDFISSLLQKDYKKRLGTVSNDQISRSSFFETIDWDLVEKRETAAAFVPSGSYCYNQDDRDEALSDYLSRSAQSSAADPHPWFLGLDVVTSHPYCQEDDVQWRRS